MRSLPFCFPARIVILACSLILLTSRSEDCVAMDITQAADQVKNLTCKDGQTVAEVLDHSVKRRSQRDLGWRTFQEEDYYDIERAVLITKGMEFRYRWRVDVDGRVSPQSSRAERLCDSESD